MLRYVTWSTPTPIPLFAGQVKASGEAMPQVRDFVRAATLNDTVKLAAHVQAIIAQSLAEVLHGMEPSAEQLIGLRDEIASVTLVSANMKLAMVGVTLLDLIITETSITLD